MGRGGAPFCIGQTPDMGGERGAPPSCCAFQQFAPPTPDNLKCQVGPVSLNVGGPNPGAGIETRFQPRSAGRPGWKMPILVGLMLGDGRLEAAHLDLVGGDFDDVVAWGLK